MSPYLPSRISCTVSSLMILPVQIGWLHRPLGAAAPKLIELLNVPLSSVLNVPLSSVQNFLHGQQLDDSARSDRMAPSPFRCGGPKTDRIVECPLIFRVECPLIFRPEFPARSAA